MRALEILQDKLSSALDFVHAKQLGALWRAVEGLLLGGELVLTSLGRNLPGECSDKHRIKAIDRIVGNARLQMQTAAIYAALAQVLLRGVKRPIILIDWTAVNPSFWALSAGLVFQGRAIPLFTQTFPKSRKCSPKAEKEFLDTLKTSIPEHCKPILVSDAGFLLPWFDLVRAAGWDFVGRVRGKLTVAVSGNWQTLGEIHTLATQRARTLKDALVSKKYRRAERVVLSSQPKAKGRHKIGREGARGNSTADRQRAAAAREPLVLITSLDDFAHVVVRTYRQRMQVEETFRDTKSSRYGWSAKDIRCKSAKRTDVLLLIGAMAAVAMHIVGLAVRGTAIERGFQANTERKRAVFSTFFLAKLTFARGLDVVLSNASLCAAFARVRGIVRAAALSPPRTANSL